MKILPTKEDIEKTLEQTEELADPCQSHAKLAGNIKDVQEKQKKLYDAKHGANREVGKPDMSSLCKTTVKVPAHSDSGLCCAFNSFQSFKSRIFGTCFLTIFLHYFVKTKQ